MRQDRFLGSFGWPFLVTIIGVGVAVLLGSCDSTTACQVKTFTTGPLLLVLLPIIGFIAGWVSPSSWIGLGAMAAAASVVATLTISTDLWRQSADAAAQRQGADEAASVVLSGLAVALMLPGFVIGRWRRAHLDVAGLERARDAGRTDPEEFQRQMALRGRVRHPDQAPPRHRCGRCRKPLSPVWRGKRHHCGALYAEFPPVPDGDAR